MNAFGENFRISIFGESHNHCVGVTIDGCIAGVPLVIADFADDLNRRKPNKLGTTNRTEDDLPQILSGVFNDKTTGSPITIIFNNNNVNSDVYSPQNRRPSHCDFVANHKFNGFNDYRGAGMFSGRMTVGIVAAGVVAKKIIPQISICATVVAVGGIKNNSTNNDLSNEILDLIENTCKQGDSLGGVIECTIKNVPIGLGEPFFNSLESMLSHLIFSIPGIKGIEFGAGFNIANMKGSQANDCYIDEEGTTKTNNSGGINAGISNGNDIVFKVAVRPTPSIKTEQETYNIHTKKVEKIKIIGKHDTCFAVRMPVIIEAAAAIVLADAILTNNSGRAYELFN
ncbi:Chorismate synthase [bioreactor metagenome]|uniref:chorismate synthase n=1 Tax=bioreactor metagenome TaxID=1076179 RepID=A0A645CLB8_9ZZZZ